MMEVCDSYNVETNINTEDRRKKEFKYKTEIEEIEGRKKELEKRIKAIECIDYLMEYMEGFTPITGKEISEVEKIVNNIQRVNVGLMDMWREEDT